MKASQFIAVFSAALLATFVGAPSVLGDTFNVSNVVQFRNALISAADNGESDIINVAAGTYDIDATLSYWSSEPYSLTIIGAGSETTILDGGRARRILFIETTSELGNVEVRALTFRNEGTAGNGGGIFIETSSGAIILNYCEMIDDSSFVLGGGACLVSNDGHVSVLNCTFLRNKSADSGGLNAASSYGDVTLINTVFEENTAFGNETIYGDDGGAHMLYTEGGGSMTIRGCSYIGNYSEDGGACFVRANVSATIKNHEEPFLRQFR